MSLGASARVPGRHGVDMMAMTTMTHTMAASDSTLDGHGALFSDPETVEAVVVPDLDPAAAAAVFSSPF